MSSVGDNGSKIIIEETLNSNVIACDWLARRTGLSKGRVKDAMNKGACRVKKGGRGSMQRLRRATAELSRGDQIAFYYDAHVLSVAPLRPALLADEGAYSVWYKPASMMSQGNEFGDHCSLLRQVEVLLEPRREVLLVHRLDQPATGLMVVAHRGDVAARLSEAFSSRTVIKRYRVGVATPPAAIGESRVIETPLDGKSARSEVVVLGESDGRWCLDVTIESGRRHQIRRHLAECGSPVIGDREYGGTASPMLNLTCVELGFTCPVSGTPKRWTLEENEVEWQGL